MCSNLIKTSNNIINDFFFFFFFFFFDFSVANLNQEFEMRVIFYEFSDWKMSNLNRNIRAKAQIIKGWFKTNSRERTYVIEILIKTIGFVACPNQLVVFINFLAVLTINRISSEYVPRTKVLIFSDCMY